MPFSAWIDRLCVAFHCRPSEAYREWQDAPPGLIEEILNSRAYADAKSMYDRLGEYDEKTRKKLMDDPLMQRVKAVDFELAARAQKAGT
jgi:hypothetical protein